MPRHALAMGPLLPKHTDCSAALDLRSAVILVTESRACGKDQNPRALSCSVHGHHDSMRRSGEARST